MGPMRFGLLFKCDGLGVRAALDAVELDGHTAAAFHQEVILDFAPAGDAVCELEVLEVLLVDEGHIASAASSPAPEEAHEPGRYARRDTGALAGAGGQDLDGAVE